MMTWFADSAAPAWQGDEVFGQIFTKPTMIGLEEMAREDAENLRGTSQIFSILGGLKECDETFEQVHVRILSADQIRPWHRIEVAAAGRRDCLVEKGEGLVYDLQNLIIASEPMIPSKP
jgi:hypothetical protein